MLNEVKHLGIAREILRYVQNDIVRHLTCDRALGLKMSCLAVKLPPARVPLDEVEHGLVFGCGAFRLAVIFHQSPAPPLGVFAH